MLLPVAPINIHLHERTLTSSLGAFVADLGPRCSAYQQSIAATLGFESQTFRLTTTLEEALRLMQWPMYGVRAYGPHADVCWEGAVTQISATMGDHTRSISIDPVSNRVTVKYTLPGLGTPQTTAAASVTGSTTRYGTKDLVLRVGVSDAAAATALRDAALSERAYPQAVPASTMRAAPGGGGGGGVEVQITAAGWYTTLDWVALTRTDTSAEQTTTQVGALIGTASPGIGATNPFLSTSTADITASGVSDTRQTEEDVRYREKIEALLGRGTSAGERLAWGVYENRRLRVRQWAGATPDTIAYRVRLGSSLVERPGGSVVPWWAVRPDAMVEVVDLLDPAPAGPIDTGARFYLERVTFSVDGSGLSLSLEPAAFDSVDARVARLQR